MKEYIIAIKQTKFLWRRLYRFKENITSTLITKSVNRIEWVIASVWWYRTNNEYNSRIGQYKEYTSSDPFFKNYFEKIYDKILKKYQLFLFDADNYYYIRKIGAHEVLFLNNLFSFYDTTINLSDKILQSVKIYFDKIGQAKNPIIFMSRALENYKRGSFRQKHNSQVKHFSEAVSAIFRDEAWVAEKLQNEFHIRRRQSFLFFEKTFWKSPQRCRDDRSLMPVSSGITVIDSDKDFDENILSVALNDNSQSRFITYLSSKDYSTLLFKLSKTKATYTFYYYNSDTNAKVKKDNQRVYF